MGKPKVFRYRLVFKADEFETKTQCSEALLLDDLEWWSPETASEEGLLGIRGNCAGIRKVTGVVSVEGQRK